MNENTPKNSMEFFQKMLDREYIVQCPVCDSFNAYAWEDVNMLEGSRMTPADGFKDGGEEYTEDEYLPAWPDVYHIPSASGFEWQCGNCKTYLMPIDSPLNHPAYTHSED